MSPGPSVQFDRKEVLQRAMELFWAQGYEATGISELVECMGIGRQSLYNTFGDKRALFLEVLEEYDRGFVQPILDVLDAPGSPLGNVRALMDMWVEMADQEDCKGCLFGNASAEFGSSDDEVARKLREAFQRVEDGLSRTFERAREAGELPADTVSRDLARLFMTTGQGLAMLSQVKESRAFARSVVGGLRSLLPKKKR